jgi:hypothetical protein
MKRRTVLRNGWVEPIHPGLPQPAVKEDPEITRLYDDTRAEEAVVLQIVATGKRMSNKELSQYTGPADISRFLQRCARIPWLRHSYTKEGILFTIDYELKEICEWHTSRPELNGRSYAQFYADLRQEITRRRKKAKDYSAQTNWNPDSAIKVEMHDLLDWIELQLDRIVTLQTAKTVIPTVELKTFTQKRNI